MIENNNISFIEENEPNDNPITMIQEEQINEQIPQQINSQNINQQVVQNSDYIKELPKWDINPPLEINRGEK